MKMIDHNRIGLMPAEDSGIDPGFGPGIESPEVAEGVGAGAVVVVVEEEEEESKLQIAQHKMDTRDTTNLSD